MLFGAAFVLRYIVFESLYAPTGGTLARLLTVLLEGVSLGALQYDPAAPATGYLAFLALTLYLVGLFLLRPPPRGVTALAPRSVDATAVMRVLVLCVLAGTAACGEPAWVSDPGEGNGRTKLVSTDVRDRSLRAARVWQRPAIPRSRSRSAATRPTSLTGRMSLAGSSSGTRAAGRRSFIAPCRTAKS